MRLAKLITIISLVLLVTTAFAADPVNQPSQNAQPEPAKNVPQMKFEANTTYQLLGHTTDLWHDAVLKGNERQANFYLVEINDIIAEDIQTDRLQMKMVVRQIEHFYRQQSSENLNLVAGSVETEDIIRYKEFLPLISANINVKEELYQAMNRTDAFSNKYRLLGDYKDLLRRELGMPRLNVAEIPQPESKQASADR
jgi:hypothetical protein